jgi:hypothetical protein
MRHSDFKIRMSYSIANVLQDMCKKQIFFNQINL